MGLQMQQRACHLLLYIEDQNWTEKVERREWKEKKTGSTFPQQRIGGLFMDQIGYSQL